MGVWGLCPQKIFQKINLEIAYFSSFLQAEMERRQDREGKRGRGQKISPHGKTD